MEDVEKYLSKDEYDPADSFEMSTEYNDFMECLTSINNGRLTDSKEIWDGLVYNKKWPKYRLVEHILSRMIEGNSNVVDELISVIEGGLDYYPARGGSTGPSWGRSSSFWCATRSRG
jgi:hypothetical protein